MSDKRRRPGLFWPLLLVGLGVLLLLQNAGLLPAGLWAALAQLWPALFILIGLDMLLGRRSPAGMAFVLVVSTLLVAGALTWAAVRASQLPPGGQQSLIQTSLGAERLAVEIAFKAGELRVGALGASDSVLEGVAHNGPGETVDQAYRVSGGAGWLTLRQKSSALLLPFLAGREAMAQWDLRLSPALSLTLEVSTGAGLTTLDLSDLQVSELDLSAGVGQTVVIFPGAGALVANINTGVGDTHLTLPANFPVRVTVHAGLTSLNMPAGLARDGNVYTTAGFNTEGDYLDLEINAGVGAVRIE